MSNNLESTSIAVSAFDQVAPHYDQLMQSVPYRFWLKYLHTVWQYYKHEPLRVIDLACGTGTLSQLMAEEGLLVTGVDIASKMLEQARRKSVEAGLYIDYVNQDATQLDLPSKDYDTVISLFDSLNNIVEPRDLEQCFLRVKRHLLPDGLFVFDLNTAHAFREGMFNQKSIPSDGPLQYRWTSSFDETTRLCRVCMSFEHKAGRGEIEKFEEVHLQRAYSIDEVTVMLHSAGFGRVDVFDAYSVKPPKRRSDRVFFAAT